MATPHIEANEGDIASIVLMPGDPLRAKYIAEKYLENAFMFNDVRNMLGYTGFYKGKKVSVMGSGMGMPSIGIYSYELFKFYNVEKIIRIGSCGALTPDLRLFDVVLADNVYSDSNYGYIQNGSNEKLISGSIAWLEKIETTAQNKGIKIIKGNIYSTDVFTPYYQDGATNNEAAKYHCLASEMETFALFHNASILNKEAACLLTVVDSPYLKNNVSSEEREASLVKMIELALESIY